MVPESPRWLLAQEREQEAADVIKHIADINRKELPETIEFDLPVVRREEALLLLQYFQLIKFSAFAFRKEKKELFWICSSILSYAEKSA